LVDDEPSDKSGSGPSDHTEPGVSTHRAKNRTDSGAGSRSRKRALLSWGHVRAGNDRQAESGEQKKPFHPIPQVNSVSGMAGRGSARSESGTTRRSEMERSGPARRAPN
jgi:hypothetical protein